MNRLAQYWKGILAFITPGVTLLVTAVTAVTETSPGGTHVTGAEWVGIGAAMIVTGGVVTLGPANQPAANPAEPELAQGDESAAVADDDPA
jgi:hypothetical protein